MTRRALAALGRHRDGVTAIEFGLVALPLCIILTATLDLGFTAYVRSMVQGALQTAARDAAIGTKSSAMLDADVKAALGPIVPANYVSTSIRSYYDFSSIGKAEKFIDANNNGKYDYGECFEDDNDNGVHDSATSAGSGTGGNADEIVAYTITVTYPRMLPMATLLGWSANNTVTATTMLRNQPFAKDVTPKWVGSCS